MKIENLLDENEVAKIQKRSTRTVQRERETGTGCPYIALGRSIRYRPEDVEQFILSKLQRKTPKAMNQPDNADAAQTVNKNEECSPHQETRLGQ